MDMLTDYPPIRIVSPAGFHPKNAAVAELVDALA